MSANNCAQVISVKISENHSVDEHKSIGGFLSRLGSCFSEDCAFVVSEVAFSGNSIGVQ